MIRFAPFSGKHYAQHEQETFANHSVPLVRCIHDSARSTITALCLRRRPVRRTFRWRVLHPRGLVLTAPFLVRAWKCGDTAFVPWRDQYAMLHSNVQRSRLASHRVGTKTGRGSVHQRKDRRWKSLLYRRQRESHGQHTRKHLPRQRRDDARRLRHRHADRPPNHSTERVPSVGPFVERQGPRWHDVWHGEFACSKRRLGRHTYVGSAQV